ncbi:MAG: hypothetical protein LBG13_00055 [Holosporales bacterium]|nr:hypothetical protein [Holosporales bacterium]
MGPLVNNGVVKFWIVDTFKEMPDFDNLSGTATAVIFVDDDNQEKLNETIRMKIALELKSSKTVFVTKTIKDDCFSINIFGGDASHDANNDASHDANNDASHEVFHASPHESLLRSGILGAAFVISRVTGATNFSMVLQQDGKSIKAVCEGKLVRVSISERPASAEYTENLCIQCENTMVATGNLFL